MNVFALLTMLLFFLLERCEEGVTKHNINSSSYVVQGIPLQNYEDCNFGRQFSVSPEMKEAGEE